jgi:hypothetical protein
MLLCELQQTLCLVKGARCGSVLLALLARAAGFVSNEKPAGQSGVPVQTVLIRSRRPFLAKRVPFFSLDLSFPIGYAFEMGTRFDPRLFRKAREVSTLVDAYSRTALTC